MNHMFKFVLLGALSLMLLAGCDNSEDSTQTVNIAPGAFVSTEPSALHGTLDKSEKCSLDTINGQQRKPGVGWEIKRGEPIDLEGWAFSNDGKKVTPDVYIQLSGQVDTYYAVTNIRLMRSDANEHLAIDPTLKGGFQLKAKTDAIEPGSYDISVVQSFPDHKETCGGDVSLMVD